MKYHNHQILTIKKKENWILANSIIQLILFYYHINLIEKAMKFHQILIVTLILAWLNQDAIGQTKQLNNFSHHELIVDGDTINYHVYASNENNVKQKNLLLYLQGSSASSILQIKEINGQKVLTTAIPIDLDQIPHEYDFVMISKKGFPWSMEVKREIKVPDVYYEHQTLAYRAFQADEVLKHLLNKRKYAKIVVLGHSEGSDVVAKLGTLNTEITHFGYLSGGGANQILDFILFIRREALMGNMSEEESVAEINSTLDKYTEIMDNSDAIDKFWSGKTNSYKRWSSFSEPPIANLLKIDKPIFAAIGSQDNSVALESFYLIPIEFIRYKKDNLTFKVYPDLDHQFGKILADGSYKDEWKGLIGEFLIWVDSIENN